MASNLTSRQQARATPTIISQPVPSDEKNVCSYSCGGKRRIYIVASVFAVAVIVTIAIVVPLAFSYVNYNEYGFKRQRSTGKVWLDKIYKSGRYLHGPDYDFHLYRADAHYLDLIETDVFTKDKLEVKITAHMQYLLREDELTILHKKFNVYYQDVMKTSAVDALKGAIPIYTTRDLIQNRSAVEAELYRAVRQRLGGICCRPNCSSYDHACPPGCKPVSQCSDSDKGINVDVILFQLGRTRIPSDVEIRFMEALVLQETTLREKLLQNASVVRKETQGQVLAIKNEALEITANATAQADLINDIANSDYTRMITEAKIIGLVKALKKLNITEQEHKLSYDYMKSLIGNKNVKLTVNFDQLIAGNF